MFEQVKNYIVTIVLSSGVMGRVLFYHGGPFGLPHHKPNLAWLGRCCYSLFYLPCTHTKQSALVKPTRTNGAHTTDKSKKGYLVRLAAHSGMAVSAGIALVRGRQVSGAYIMEKRGD